MPSLLARALTRLKKVVLGAVKRVLSPRAYNALRYWIFFADLAPYASFLRRRLVREQSEKVSIFIPSYTNTTFLREAVLSALGQTYRNIEVLVMTDVPECGAADVLRDLLPAIRFFAEPTLHRERKLNELVRRSSGRLLLFLCDDDKIDRTFVEKTVYAMRKHDADIVYSDMRVFGDRNLIAACRWESPFEEGSPIPITSLYTRSLFDRVGGYEDPLGDWGFWWAAANMGAKAVRVGQPLFHYRVRPGQDTERMGEEGWREARAIIRKRHGAQQSAPPGDAL
ncbi:MAG: glycosyltransferase [Elusimicrobia bacterium]|nr:glycosyltransferase [Elusimicrobiota bacterium]